MIKIIKKNQIVDIKWNGNNRRTYIDKGYIFTKIGEILSIKAEDLAKTSKTEVVVVCDNCNDNEYITSNYNANKSKEHTCNHCKKNRNKITVSCESCQIVFQTTKTALNKSKSGNMFCSNICVGKYNSTQKDKRKTKNCVICHEDYKVKQAHADKSVTCSNACQSKWQSNYLVGENANNYKGGSRTKPCNNCGIEYTSNSPSEHKTRKYCSVECRQDYWSKNTLVSSTFVKNRRRGNVEYRKKMSEQNIETNPERLVREYLESCGLIKNKDFYQEQGFFGKYFTDFFLHERKLVIEVMGDYWHANPIIYGEGKGKIPLSEQQIDRVSRDIQKKKDFLKYDFNYIEIWETDINKDLKNTMDKFKNEIFPVTTARRTS